MTSYSLIWLGDTGVVVNILSLSVSPVVAASAVGWGSWGHSGVRQDRLGTPFQGCCRTRQLGDTVSGHSPHATGMTRGGWDWGC